MTSLSAPLLLSPHDAAVLALARKRGVLRARDLEAHGLARTYLRRLQERGLLVSVGRGLYVPADAPQTEHQTLIEVARGVPGGVICLLSALRFHEIGTQNPSAVWLALENGSRVPRLALQPHAYPPLEIVRQSGAAWREGAATHDLSVGDATVPVKITTPAKTVADCFKFRRRVGQDVALEALRAVLEEKRHEKGQMTKTTVGDLWHYAEVNRVLRVMGPAIEAMLAR